MHIPSEMLLFFAAILLSPLHALHHMRREPIAYVAQRSSEVPLVVHNQCADVVYPGVFTQSGVGPGTGGFRLESGATKNMIVSANWQGRVWARTNCSFNDDGTAAAAGVGRPACTTGDCFGVVECQTAGATPVSLAEFTLATASGQTFYDISLVDGYNVPIAIISLYPESGNSSLQEIPPNLTNPICIGTAALLAEQGSTIDSMSGTNASFPISLDQSQSRDDVASWCPFELQLQMLTRPANGIYSYPDGSLQRATFNACFSACAKYNKPEDCCTGSYNDPDICRPGQYSRDAKRVCPDAYSFAFDDQTSTFIIPSGGGFQITFCPVGRSSNILDTNKAQLVRLAQTGHVTPRL